MEARGWCSDQVLHGHCGKGASCPFLHEDPRPAAAPARAPASSASRSSGRAPCRFWNGSGGCSKGDACAFAHEQPPPWGVRPPAKDRAGKPRLRRDAQNPRPDRRQPPQSKGAEPRTGWRGTGAELRARLDAEERASTASRKAKAKANAKAKAKGGPRPRDAAAIGDPAARPASKPERQAAPLPPSAVPCRFFSTSGRCRSGDACRFVHRGAAIASSASAPSAPSSAAAIEQARNNQAAAAPRGVDANAAGGRAFYEAKLAELNQEKVSLIDGTHLEIIENQKQLAITRDRQLKDAALLRELRIREVEALYKYDCQAAKEAFGSALNDVRDNLLNEINDSIKRMEDLRDGVREGAEIRSSARKLRSKKPDGEEEREVEVPDSNSNAGNESNKSVALAGFGTDTLSGINFFMAANSAGEDLRAIQQDWKDRAERFLSEQEVAEESVKVNDGVLFYNEMILDKDAEVVCTTELSKETLYGTIQAIKPSEVIIKHNDGTQSRLLIMHLRTGRCTIAPIEDE